MHFENQKACSLFLISILTGNPTSTVLICNAYKNNNISKNEANRLLKFCSFVTPLFIINIIGGWISIVIIISQLLSSIIIGIISKCSTSEYSNRTMTRPPLFNMIIQSCPTVMLNILMVMIFVGLFKVPVEFLFDIFKVSETSLLKIFTDFFEITTGIIAIKEYAFSSFLIFMFLNLIISLGGIAIILQVYLEIKKTNLQSTSFFKGRFLNTIISSVIFSLLYFLIF